MTTTSTERVRAMRQRRRQALDAATEAEVALRDVDTMLAPAVAETLAALELDEADAAAAKLALQLARQIDQCKDQSWGYRWLSPLLMDVLVQLGATPMARAKAKGGKPAPQGLSKLDQLRAARATADRRRGLT